MPCPHNEITIVQRSQQQSAVAAAAYQSGEKLFCEYDQEVKHYPEKRGIVHNEILLPENAPPEYADRNTLWNAAEAVVTPIQLHAWGFIVMERAASHPVPTYMDSIMLRSLSCCDGLLHSFKYIQIYPSLKRKKHLTFSD